MNSLLLKAIDFLLSLISLLLSIPISLILRIVGLDPLRKRKNNLKTYREIKNRNKVNFKSPKALYTYFSLAKDLYIDGEKDLQEVFNLYDVVKNKMEVEEGKLAKLLTALIDKEAAGQAMSSKEKKRLGQRKIKNFQKNK